MTSFDLGTRIFPSVTFAWSKLGAVHTYAFLVKVMGMLLVRLRDDVKEVGDGEMGSAWLDGACLHSYLIPEARQSRKPICP